MLCLRICVFLVLVASATSFFGNFYLRVESVKHNNKINRDVMSWTLYMNRTSRYTQYMQGSWWIKKNCGPITARMELKKMCEGTNMWKPYKVNQMSFGKICKDLRLNVFFSRFKPVKLLNPDECIYEPMTAPAILEPTDIHKELHAVMGIAEHGRWKVNLIYEADGRIVMGYEIIVCVEKR